MKHLKIILFLCLIFFIGCENEELLNPELIYKEQVVVHCQISPENNFPGVSLTRTLPLDVTFDINLAEIKDATLYLRIDGYQIIPLHYTEDGMYKPLYEFSANENAYFELFGQWNEYSFYAKTKIPIEPIVNSVNINLNEYYSEADITVFRDEVYAALWAVDIGTFETATDFYNVSKPEENSLNNSIGVRSASYPIEYQSSTYNGRRYIRVYSFDSSFDDYFKTKIQNEEINNPYVQGSGNTIWNIEGEDVIGMFIGINKSDYILVN
jgi:hypothetical protein